jgi:hypothetical protein
MSDKKALRYLAVPVMLLAVVALATLGCVWHRHASSTDTNCSICHIDHQQMANPHVSDSTPALAMVGRRCEALRSASAGGPVMLRTPVRAPPTA